MVRKLLKYINSSIFISAIVLIILIYTKAIIPYDRHPFVSVSKQKDVHILKGKILSSPKKLSNGKYYSTEISINQTVSIKQIQSSAKGNVSVFIPSELVEALYPGKLYTSAKTGNKFIFESGAECSFEGNFSKGIFYVNKCTECDYEKNLSGIISNFRSLCRLQFKRLMYGWGKAGGLFLALLSGSREYTEKSLSENFKTAGLSHILALSGMHLSLFSGLVVFMGKKIKRKKLTVIIRILTIILFVWFAGFSPSLLRAFICNFLLIIALIGGSADPDMFLLLALSFILQTIITPGDLFNSGFILSYTALAGILIFNRIFLRYYNFFLPSYGAVGFASSTGAQLLTAPVSLKMFGSFSPFGIISTFVVSPVVTFFIYSGLFLFVVSLLFPVMSVPSGIFMNFQYNLIKLLVEFFARLPVIKLN